MPKQEPEGDAGGNTEDVIEVVEGAFLTAQIYQCCTWDAELPFGSAAFFFRDISAQEIKAAAEMHRAPVDEWPRIIRLIKHHMVPAARAEFNAKR